jgi:hypothetical protein
MGLGVWGAPFATQGKAVLRPYIGLAAMGSTWVFVPLRIPEPTRCPSMLRASRCYQLMAYGGHGVCNLLRATVF